MEDIVVINKLTKRYKKGVTALHDVNLKIKKGEIFGLLGPNGAGKTTLINCIASIAAITEGSILIDGNDVIKDYLEAKKLIGLSPQDMNFDIYFNIYDILVYQAGYYGIRKKYAIEKTEKMLKLFGLYDKKKKEVLSLSGGMKRKFSIAKAMIHEPKILILDEPTAALDVDARIDLWKYIRKINKEGVSIILTTHYIEEAEELADRVCIINKGRILKLENKDKIMDTLSENIISFFLDKPLSKKSILKSYNYSVTNNILNITTPRKEQNKVLKEVINLLDKNKVLYHNFEIREDSLENIFLRLIKNDKN